MENLGQTKEKTKEIKIILLGESGVGKTSFFKRFIFNEYGEQFVSSIGVDYAFKNINYKKKDYLIQLFDIAGQLRFRNVVKSYFHITDKYFVIFDLTDEDSLKDIHNWIDSIKEYSEKYKFIILGNKDDLENKISDEIINDNLKKYADIIFMRVSAANNYNINEAIERMIDLDNNGGGKKQEDVNSFQIRYSKKVKKSKKSKNCC